MQRRGGIFCRQHSFLQSLIRRRQFCCKRCRIFHPSLREQRFDFIFCFSQVSALLWFVCVRGVHGDRRRRSGNEDAIPAVIILLTDGIELVIMTAGARNRQTLERFRHGADLVVGESNLFIERISGGKTVDHHSQMSDAEG